MEFIKVNIITENGIEERLVEFNPLKQFICKCGRIISLSSKQRHLQSANHLIALESLEINCLIYNLKSN